MSQSKKPGRFSKAKAGIKNTGKKIDKSIAALGSKMGKKPKFWQKLTKAQRAKILAKNRAKGYTAVGAAALGTNLAINKLRSMKKESSIKKKLIAIGKKFKRNKKLNKSKYIATGVGGAAVGAGANQAWNAKKDKRQDAKALDNARRGLVLGYHKGYRAAKMEKKAYTDKQVIADYLNIPPKSVTSNTKLPESKLERIEIAKLIGKKDLGKSRTFGDLKKTAAIPIKRMSEQQQKDYYESGVFEGARHGLINALILDSLYRASKYKTPVSNKRVSLLLGGTLANMYMDKARDRTFSKRYKKDEPYRD